MTPFNSLPTVSNTTALDRLIDDTLHVSLQIVTYNWLPKKECETGKKPARFFRKRVNRGESGNEAAFRSHDRQQKQLDDRKSN